MPEYIINEFITLKLEDGITNIYILGKEFIQCKYLLINVPVREIGLNNDINSIDEAVEKLDKSLDLGNPEGHQIRKEILPEVEFWGHCSNMQVWAEQEYDTRFIRSNLAFPLLKKLTEVGDPKAKKIFKDEIGKRFEKGSDSVRQFLVLEGYLDYLSREEMWSVMPNQTEVKILHAIERETEAEFKLRFNKIEEPNQLAFSIKGDYVMKIDFLNFKTLSALKWEKTFALLSKLKALKWLHLSRNNLKTIPDSVRDIKSLKVLKMDYNELKELPETIGELENLIWLILNNNKIKTLPESIGKLLLLEELRLDNNQLTELPNSIGKLKGLVKLHLGNNYLKKFPNPVIGMKSLAQLALSNNFLSDIPKKITEMKSLKGLALKGNKIKESFHLSTLLKKKGINVLI